ncbi:hypothetical protein GH714_003976 [Hevea brasiliensis]|uniref:Reverse transcriptase Ty1/copia-type domain-containing protein n=1 Tax=Hevea brasiliensis TaxID=3981 RepID=A0A6A6KXD8_HEVBR|nr:hypothetical protein GH714_003976 [Hevea brasiliensis]
MTKKSVFEIWNFLKNEYEGDERIKGMQVLNLVREFEMQKMKESGTIKEHIDKLLSIVNKNAKDLLRISLVELLNALQVQEQRRIMTAEGSVEGALQAKVQIKKNKKKNSSTPEATANTSNSNGGNNKEFPPCRHYGKKGHPLFKCWRRPDVKCAAKRVLSYVKGTLDHGILFQQSQDFQFLGFSDRDSAGSYDDMNSTLGYCFTLGSGVFSWSSKKQEIVAQSTAEAEFITATTAVNQALWLKKLLVDLHMEQKESTKVFVDNQAAIAISNNPVFHGKTKHLSIKLFFLRDVQKNGAVCLKYCKTEN